MTLSNPPAHDSLQRITLSPTTTELQTLTQHWLLQQLQEVENKI